MTDGKKEADAGFIGTALVLTIVMGGGAFLFGMGIGYVVTSILVTLGGGL